MSSPSNNIRVVQLVRALDVGGLERVVMDLLRGLNDRGVSCHVGCLSHPGVQIDKAQKDGLWVGGLGEHGRLRVLLSLCRYIRRERIDLIHSHNPTPHLFAVLAGILTRTPVIHTKHGRNYPENARWVWLSRQLSRFSRKIVAVSQDAADVVVKVEKVPGRKVVVLQNGIDVDAYGGGEAAHGSYGLTQMSKESAEEETPSSSPIRVNPCSSVGITILREELGVPRDAFVIGSVGRYSPEKCYPMLIEAFAMFVRDCGSGISPHLVLVGDGPDRENIEGALVRHGMEQHVTLTGMSDRVADWLRVMDLFTLSSRTEGTSITLLEAGASGLPAVVTDVGGNREIVDGGDAGVLVPAGDPNILASALLDLAEDEARRQELGDKARTRVSERYSIDAMVDWYMRVYNEEL